MKLSNQHFICSIYKLTNSIDDRFYYGSTRESLPQRMALHRQSARQGGNSALYQAMRGTTIAKWTITLVEKHLCEKSPDQFKAEESVVVLHRDDPNCLNERMAYTTKAQKIAQAKVRLQNIIASKTHHCECCRTTCVNNYALNKHYATTKHIRRFIAY
jgi:hypothetical protein